MRVETMGWAALVAPTCWQGVHVVQPLARIQASGGAGSPSSENWISPAFDLCTKKKNTPLILDGDAIKGLQDFRGNISFFSHLRALSAGGW